MDAEIRIERNGQYNHILINNATQYRFTSSEDGTTELVITIKSDKSIVKYGSSTMKE